MSVPSKKRKRESAPEPKLTVSTVQGGRAGPTLVNYPCVEPSSSTLFNCYARKKAKGEPDDAEPPLLVVGETSAVELVSNDEESRRIANSGCRYVIAVRNKKTNSIVLYPTQKFPHLLTRTVKALKSLPSLQAPSKSAYLEAKNALGDTFGTKKAKANIRAQERNKVDITAMEGVMGHVIDTIHKGAEGLLTNEELKEAADNNRPIPPFDATATEPGEIYGLYDIIPEVEWRALSTSAFDEATTDKERSALLPYRQSDWIYHHLRGQSQSTSKSRKRNLKILLYISYMLAFRKLSFQKTINKEKLYQRLEGVPSIIADGLLARFTESARGSPEHQPTSATKTRLLTYMFALCLKLDNYASNTKTIAHDLSLPVSEVNQLFKSLGCKISKLGEQERRKLGIPPSSADERHAVLTAPVEFPKIRRRKQ